MSDLTPVLQEMAERPDATEMLMPHDIRRAGERRRRRVAMATATCVVTLVAVAAGVLIRGITWDTASVGPAGHSSPNPSATVSIPTLAGPGRPGDLPPGTYRYTLTRHELLGHGLGSDDARAEAGVWTWTLGNGRWSYHLQNFDKPACWTKYTATHHFPHGHVLGCHLQYAGNHCAGFYDVVGHDIEFTTVTRYANGSCAPSIWFGSWSLAGDLLQMPNQIYANGYMFGGRPWERIAGNG